MKGEKTLRQVIEKIVGGETIEAIVIGKFMGGIKEKERELPKKVKNQVVSWEIASKFLNYKTSYRFDGLTLMGFKDFHLFTLWTPNRVFFVEPGHYSYGIRIVWIPRHPIPGDPSDRPMLELTVPRYSG